LGSKPSNPDRLKGRGRAIIMRLYLRGEITWHEAGDLIGVHHLTIYRWQPADFDWVAARAAHVDRLVERVIVANVRKKPRKAKPKLRVIEGSAK
jgi:hypothetical protein